MSRRADGRKVSEWRGRFERFRRAGLTLAPFLTLITRRSFAPLHHWLHQLTGK